VRGALHDKIDAREQLASEANDLIESVKRQFADIFEGAAGEGAPMAEAISRTMEAMAELVEDGLTDLTTKAVRAGADGARKVARK
jgi:predicted component of type VI protein secretion system